MQWPLMKLLAQYNRFRYYDPSIGRYINADPIGQWGGHNLYSYVGNRPTRFFDPTGLIPPGWASKNLGSSGIEYTIGDAASAAGQGLAASSDAISDAIGFGTPYADAGAYDRSDTTLQYNDEAGYVVAAGAAAAAGVAALECTAVQQAAVGGQLAAAAAGEAGGKALAAAASAVAAAARNPGVQQNAAEFVGNAAQGYSDGSAGKPPGRPVGVSAGASAGYAVGWAAGVTSKAASANR